MFWAERDDLATILGFGVRYGQLCIHGAFAMTDAVATAWKSRLDAAGFTIVTVFAAFDGEDYADIPAVQRTVGFIPRATRAAREQRMLAVSDFAANLGVNSIACHIGFVPEDAADPDYAAVRDMVRRVCDHAAARGQTFALETGQERAEVLLAFIRDVDRPNLRINFDPANLILYGTDEPIAALRTLAPLVVSVHCKDGDGPAPGVPGALGTERPLGKGSVGIPRFVATLREIGFQGPLNVERETENHDERLRDIGEGIALLRSLSSKTRKRQAGRPVVLPGLYYPQRSIQPERQDRLRRNPDRALGHDLRYRACACAGSRADGRALTASRDRSDDGADRRTAAGEFARPLVDARAAVPLLLEFCRVQTILLALYGNRFHVQYYVARAVKLAAFGHGPKDDLCVGAARKHDVAVRVANVARDFRGVHLALHCFGGVDRLLGAHRHFGADRQDPRGATDRGNPRVFVILVRWLICRRRGSRRWGGRGRCRGRHRRRLSVIDASNVLHRDDARAAGIQIEGDFGRRTGGDCSRQAGTVAHHHRGMREFRRRRLLTGAAHK